jgi:hypothetical protein
MTRVPANRLMPIVVQNYVRTETDDRHSIPAAIFSFRWALTFVGLTLGPLSFGVGVIGLRRWVITVIMDFALGRII